MGGVTTAVVVITTIELMSLSAGIIKCDMDSQGVYHDTTRHMTSDSQTQRISKITSNACYSIAEIIFIGFRCSAFNIFIYQTVATPGCTLRMHCYIPFFSCNISVSLVDLAGASLCV